MDDYFTIKKVEPSYVAFFHDNERVELATEKEKMKGRQVYAFFPTCSSHDANARPSRNASNFSIDSSINSTSATLQEVLASSQR